MSRYLVYRVYTHDERPGLSIDERHPLYGWSSNKSVIKVFLSQRDKTKYAVRKVSESEIAEELSEVPWDDSNKIDYIPVRSVSTGEVVKVFMTRSEMEDIEKRIQRYFRDLSDIVELSNFRVFELFMNLRPKYYESLAMIGFNPAMDTDDTGLYRGFCTEEFQVDWEIYQAYQLNPDNRHHIPGLSTISNISNKIFYSLEGFLKVMWEDL